MVGDLADGLEPESLVPDRLTRSLGGSPERADGLHLRLAEARAVIGHDQGGIGEQEVRTASSAGVAGGVVRVLEQFER